MKTRLYQILSGILIAAYLFSTGLPTAVSATPQQVGQEQSPAVKHEPKRGTNPETGKLSFIGGGDPIFVPGVSDAQGMPPQERAMGMANAYGKEFGLKIPAQELKLLKLEKDANGKDVVRYQQVYKGVPVIAGEMIVNMTGNGELLSISGEASSDLTLNTKPAIKSQEARKTALNEIATLYKVDEKELTSTNPELWIFDESLLTASTRRVELVWRMEVTAKDVIQPIREMVLVNAQTGSISFHVNQVDTGESTSHETSQTILESQQAAPLTVASQVQYVDLVVDEARGKLYGADQTGNKVDVIDMADLSVINSYLLASGALPSGIDLSLDGSELAVAQSGLDRVKFINLIDGTISETPSALSGSTGSNPVSNPYDVIYGRPGILYVLSDNGLHVLDTIVVPHTEKATQYVAKESTTKFGAITSDKNTLFFVTGYNGSPTNELHKFNVSAGLTKPVDLAYTYLYGTYDTKNIRLSLADDSTLLTSWGSIYDVSTLTLKAKNGQSLLPVIALPGRSFYAVAYDDAANSDALYFFDEQSSHTLSSSDTNVTGAPGAMAVTSDGNTLFVSSTGGMTKFEIGTTPPGTAIALPQSLKQYRDFAFDMLRGVIYGTDASGRIDVLDQDTGNVLNSYLLPNGADPIGIDLSPDGSELAVAMNGLEAILFLNPETGAEIARVKPLNNFYSNLPYDVIYGREGRLYSDGSGDGFDYLHVIDTLTHKWLGRSSFMVRYGADLSITSDYRYIYANELGYPEEIFVFDVQVDTPVKLYEGSVLAKKFAIASDGSKMFTSDGQVWSRDIQEQIGTLEGAPGSLVEYIPGKNAVVLAVENTIKFISADDYHLISTYAPTYSGNILEMEIAPDGGKLIASFSSGNVLLLDPSTVLPAPPPTPAPSTIKYEDIVVDEARGKLYGADKDGNKIDVINISDLSVVSSFSLAYSAWPTGMDLSSDGNELAVAQSGLSRVAFINLNDGTISETASTLGGSSAKGYDVLYGRPGILYVISTSGIHVINTITHIEDTAQYITGATFGKGFGVLTSDKNTLLFITSSDTTASVFLNKVNVSAGLTKPVLLRYTYLYNSGFAKNIRQSLVDDNTLLSSWGSIFDVSTLTLKAKNGQSPFPVIALPGHSFYVVAVNNTVSSDILSFYDGQSSYKLSYLTTGVMGTPGAMAVTSDGSNLFVSSTGGMTKVMIGTNSPGMAVSLPQSQKQYRDFAFDMPRGVIYGTDASGRVDVLDQDTGNILNSYLLPNGANPIGIDLSPDDSELAIAMNGLESILFMNPETGTVIATGFPQGTAVYRNILPYDVIYGRTGRLYSNGMDTLQIFDSVTHNSFAAKSSLSTGEMILTADKKYIYDNDPPYHVYVYDVQTDNVTTPYQKTYIDANKHAIIPDGSKVFTSGGQVWNGTLQEQLGLLEGGAGNLIEYIPGQNAVVVAAQDANGSLLRFISAATHRLLTTYRPENSNNIVEMEIAPDGSKLILNSSNSGIFILDINTILPAPPIPPTPGPATIQYEDLVVDEARGKLYGADKVGSKIDVINISDMSVESSYLLIYGALPTGIDLSPDGNELAVAQSGLSRIAFINLNNGTISETPSKLTGTSTKAFDVIYGRPGIVYALSTKGIHVINTTITPHTEDSAQLAVSDSVEKFGVISSDKNTVYFVTGSNDTGYTSLRKYNVSAGLSKPVQLTYTYLYNSAFTKNIRLSLADDNTLLTSWGSIYDTSMLTLKAKNGQALLPVTALPGRSFYAVAYNNATSPDTLYFFDKQSSHQLSILSTDVTGVPGAMAVTSDGGTLFVSSTGGMTRLDIGTTPPGAAVPLPLSLRQYRDFAFDMSRGVIYGTDASGRIDVLDLNTQEVLNSFLLANGSNPIGIDLSPDGNELAIALNGLEAILFLNPETGTEIARVTPKLTVSVYYDNLPYDVIYGRTGRLYSDGSPGQSGIDYLHLFDTSTHTWLAKSSYSFRMGAELAITTDKKNLYANETLFPNNIYVFDGQTDTLTQLYEGPHGSVYASKFTIAPDGSKVFTANGQVWSGNMQTQLGTLPGGSGTLIKFIPNKNMIALSSGNAIRFFDATSYQPIWTQYANSGNILEMEVSPDGTMLIANYSDGSIFTLDLINLPPPTSTPGPGPTSTPRPTSTPGPTPTPVPSSSTGSRKTYTASGSYTTPGTFLCDQNQSICTNGADPDADKAHQYAADTFMFYNVHHGRNSFDNQGSTIISTVHFGVGYQNAFWDGYQMVYGDNMAADDVVGHEITHGVTQYASNLIYSYQSGAINESFSDVWGEFIDQTNGSGNDSLSVKWLMGEDTPLGAIRSMSDPTIFGNPDKMSSPYYYTGSGDNGGVHINSGVNNKAAYLMVDGSTFNGRTIIGIGLNKTAAVYYEAQVYHLTMGANYNDLYYALIQACQNLIGGVDGITQNDCDQVRTAAEAVEMIPTLPATATPTATSTFIPTDTPTNTPTFTPTNTFTPTATPPYSYNPLYLSLTSSQTIGGVASADEDILRFDGTNWSLFFDGSDVGVGSPDLFAFSIVDADTILMSFSANITVNGISATPQDVLRFDATSLGSATIGTFSMYFDGSDVGFDTTAENIDSLSLLPDGRLLISTTGNPSVPGLTTGKDEDVLAFTQTSFGDVTSGTWAMYFDGSDVGLADSSNEDVDALDVTSNGNIYLSTLGDFAVNGLSGFDEDVFVCTPTSIGDVTACNYSPTLYFDGSTWGLSANDVDAFNFLATGPIPTTAPSNTPTITPTRTNTPLATNTPTRTPSPTPTFTRTATSTVSPSATNTPTVTATIGGPAILTFTTVADTRVSQASPTTNYGTATTILVDGDSGAAQTGYIRFATNGISGSIQSAKLRVYCTTNGTANGPAAYLADSNWIESGTGGMTWNTQPALLSGAFDNKGAIGMDSWVEYDVTALVTGNNTYTFALVADSSDGITFSSREGTTPSQLVVALGSATPTPTATVGSSVTNTPIVTATSTRTPTATAVASPTSTNMPTATPTANITPSPTLTPTATSTLTLNFAPIDDTYIASGSPTTNYGPATTLQVDNSPIKHFLIKFDVSGLNGQQVTSAKLRLYNLDASSKGGDFYAVSDNSWQEETLTWNNAPVALTTLLASLGSVSANNWYEVDLTSLITGDGTYSLRISSTSSDGADYSSKEGANPPQLVITVH